MSGYTSKEEILVSVTVGMSPESKTKWMVPLLVTFFLAVTKQLKDSLWLTESMVHLAEGGGGERQLTLCISSRAERGES